MDIADSSNYKRNTMQHYEHLIDSTIDRNTWNFRIGLEEEPFYID